MHLTSVGPVVLGLSQMPPPQHMLTSLCSTCLCPRNNPSGLSSWTGAHLLAAIENWISHLLLSSAHYPAHGILQGLHPSQNSQILHLIPENSLHASLVPTANLSTEMFFPWAQKTSPLVFGSLHPPRSYRAVLTMQGSSTARAQAADNHVHFCVHCPYWPVGHQSLAGFTRSRASPTHFGWQQTQAQVLHSSRRFNEIKLSHFYSSAYYIHLQALLLS